MEINVKDLRVSYGKTEVLKGIDLTIRPGEKVFIGGANGSGKTTLLRALSGIIPYAGNVLIDGKEVSSMKRKEVAKLIALMPQTSDIYFPYTVNETVLLGTYASAVNSFFGTDAKAAQSSESLPESSASFIASAALPTTPLSMASPKVSTAPDEEEELFALATGVEPAT